MTHKILLVTLVAWQGAVAVAVAAPLQTLGDFELTDQNSKTRSYRFPKAKVTVMTVADQKGSAQLAPWIQQIHDRYENRIDIDGVADVSMIPKPLHGVFRQVFRKQLAYSVMLDWTGSVVKRFGYKNGVANIYVIDRRGCIVKEIAGPVNESALFELYREINRAIDGGKKHHGATDRQSTDLQRQAPATRLAAHPAAIPNPDSSNTYVQQN